MKDPEITAGYDKIPDRTVVVRDLSGIDSDMRVPVFSSANEYVPKVDDAYRYDPDTTPPVLDYLLINEHQQLPMKIYTGRRKKHELSI